MCPSGLHTRKDARADRPDPRRGSGGAGEGRDKSDAARPAAPDVEPMM